MGHSLNTLPPNRCIFCRGPGLSKEHVFPNWLRILFPRMPAQTHLHGVTTWGQSSHGKIYAMPTLTEDKGHSGSKKVKAVCKDCNTGWMSRMENRTRPILMPLIQGVFHRLSTFDQNTLAGWIAKTVMVAEFAHPTHIAIPQDERLWTYAHFLPPTHWSIWLAAYTGTVWRNLAISHHMFALGPRLDPTKIPEPGAVAPPDTQSTSIGMGHLFIQVVSTTVTNIEFSLEHEAIGDFQRIWPPSGQDITWPPLRNILDPQATYIAESFARIAGLPTG
jgi:hypothetical protein